MSVVEVMGGMCGYLATAASLSGAAMRAYVPETGISFADLNEDIQVRAPCHWRGWERSRADADATGC